MQAIIFIALPQHPGLRGNRCEFACVPFPLQRRQRLRMRDEFPQLSWRPCRRRMNAVARRHPDRQQGMVKPGQPMTGHPEEHLFRPASAMPDEYPRRIRAGQRRLHLKPWCETIRHFSLAFFAVSSSNLAPESASFIAIVQRAQTVIVPRAKHARGRKRNAHRIGGAVKTDQVKFRHERLSFQQASLRKHHAPEECHWNRLCRLRTP